MGSDLERPINIAHRGANRQAPENTLAAFEKAREMGADGIELDVQLSRDGVPVVIHDATVDATTDGVGRVAALTLAQLKRLDAGSSFSRTFAGEPIPALEEVLDALAGELLLNVELKTGGLFDHGMERAVIDVIEQHGAEEHVLVSSFNPVALRRVQELGPCIPTALLYDHLPHAGLRLAWRIMPRPHAALHPHRKRVDREHIAWAHAQNVRINVWTVDEPAEMRQMISWGVDGIITNVPDVLARVLEETG